MMEPDIQCEWHLYTSDRCSSRADLIAYYFGGNEFLKGSARCGRHVPVVSDARTAPLIRDPRPIAIMLLGIHGSLDERLAALIAEPPATGAGAVAIDLAEERGYHDGPLPVADVDRPRIERHEHVWFTVRDARGVPVSAPTLRQCPCGMFEHEAVRDIHDDRVDAVLYAIRATLDPNLAMLHDEPNLREGERPPTE